MHVNVLFIFLVDQDIDFLIRAAPCLVSSNISCTYIVITTYFDTLFLWNAYLTFLVLKLQRNLHNLNFLLYYCTCFCSTCDKVITVITLLLLGNITADLSFN